MTGYKIVASRLPIGEGIPFFDNVFGHIYIKILDPDGYAIFQADGLAVTKEGEPRAVGGPWDKLKVYAFSESIWKNHEKHESVLLYQTNDIELIRDIMFQISTTAKKINYQDVDYTLWGDKQNSNTVFNDIVTDLQKMFEAKQILPMNPENIAKAKDMGMSNPGIDKTILYKNPETTQNSQEKTQFWENIVNGIKQATVGLGNDLNYAATHKIGAMVGQQYLEQKSKDNQPIQASTENATPATSSPTKIATNQMSGFAPAEAPFNQNTIRNNQPTL